jgi:hypothetical protein
MAAWLRHHVSDILFLRRDYHCGLASTYLPHLLCACPRTCLMFRTWNTWYCVFRSGVITTLRNLTHPTRCQRHRHPCPQVSLFPLIFSVDHGRSASSLPSPLFENQVQNPMVIHVIQHVRLERILKSQKQHLAVVCKVCIIVQGHFTLFDSCNRFRRWKDSS